LFHKYAENTFKHRDHLYIIADILKVTRRGTTKTEIMYKAGLSFAQLKRFLSLLVKLELVEAATRNGKPIYRTTSKGTRYLKCYEEPTFEIKSEVATGSEPELATPEIVESVSEEAIEEETVTVAPLKEPMVTQEEDYSENLKKQHEKKKRKFF